MGSSAPRPDLVRRVLKNERLIVAAGLALLVAFSWWFLSAGAGIEDHSGMDMDMNMPGMSPPLTALIVMWWIMMVAMMLPSASPAILLYAQVRSARRDRQVAGTWIFLCGYIAVWLAFSIAAALAQYWLAGSMMSATDPVAQGMLLGAAGLYQLTPLKSSCLRQCRSPAQFISRHWRPGAAGALRLGLLHGTYCVGCCWLLMALLFVGGVMNFLWITALTLLVAIEKLVRGGEWLGRAVGVGLIGWGAYLALS